MAPILESRRCGNRLAARSDVRKELPGLSVSVNSNEKWSYFELSARFHFRKQVHDPCLGNRTSHSPFVGTDVKVELSLGKISRDRVTANRMDPAG